MPSIRRSSTPAGAPKPARRGRRSLLVHVPGAAVAAATSRRRRPRPRVLSPLPRLPIWRVRLLATFAVLGPGLVSGFADNDAGGITTYSLVGARFGYELLWVILASQVVLFFTQEVGARLGLATGKGLMGLIRERWGVRWGAFAALLMLAANLGSTVAEFAGIGSALGIFGIPPQISAAVAAVVVVAFIAVGSYGRVQYFFVGIGLFVSLAYVISAFLAGPDWNEAFHSMFVPQLSTSPVYWLAVVGTVGTTITPWGQAFIQSYVADKGLRPDDLPASRVDVFAGALLTNVIAAFIVICCAATLYASGRRRSRVPRRRPRRWNRSPARPPACCSRSGSLARRSSGWGSCRSRARTRRARRSAGRPASTGTGGRRPRSTACSRSSSASRPCS